MAPPPCGGSAGGADFRLPWGGKGKGAPFCSAWAGVGSLREEGDYDSYCSDSACPSWKLSTGKSQQELWKVWGESLLNRLGCQPCLRYWLYRGDCTNTDISTKSVLKLSI